MKRRLLNTLALASALLCVAIILCWIRSYRVSDSFGFSTLCAIWTDPGSILIARADPSARSAPPMVTLGGEPARRAERGRRSQRRY